MIQPLYHKYATGFLVCLAFLLGTSLNIDTPQTQSGRYSGHPYKQCILYINIQRGIKSQGVLDEILTFQDAPVSIFSEWKLILWTITIYTLYLSIY